MLRILVLFLFLQNNLSFAMSPSPHVKCVQLIIQDQGAITPLNALKWLENIQHLQNVAELKEYLSLFEKLTKAEKIKVIDHILRRYRGNVEKKSADEYGVDLPEQRVLQSLLAMIHNPPRIVGGATF
jgi:hypothetical protein